MSLNPEQQCFWASLMYGFHCAQFSFNLGMQQQTLLLTSVFGHMWGGHHRSMLVFDAVPSEGLKVMSRGFRSCPLCAEMSLNLLMMMFTVEGEIAVISR